MQNQHPSKRMAQQLQGNLYQGRQNQSSRLGYRRTNVLPELLFCMCLDESIVHLHDPVNEKDGMEAERSGSAAQKLPREPFLVMKNNSKIIPQQPLPPAGHHPATWLPQVVSTRYCCFSREKVAAEVSIQQVEARGVRKPK